MPTAKLPDTRAGTFSDALMAEATPVAEDYKESDKKFHKVTVEIK